MRQMMMLLTSSKLLTFGQLSKLVGSHLIATLAAMLFVSCSSEENEVMAQTRQEKLYITIDGMTKTATMVDNAATQELVTRLQQAPGITEVAQPTAGELDLFKSKNGGDTNNELRIVEIEMYTNASAK